MKITHYSEITANQLGIPGAEKVSVRVLIGPEDGAKGFVMILLEIAPGGHTPGHHHPWEEEIFVKSGSGKIKTREGERPLNAGDVLFFDPDEPHQFSNTGAEPLEFICVIPRRQ